jgi:hypothetical protein
MFEMSIVLLLSLFLMVVAYELNSGTKSFF